MSRALTADEFADLFGSCRYTAFRLELQRQYQEPGETELVNRYLAGDREKPPFESWWDIISAAVAAGKRFDRVRVQDDPPTPYQRWERWAGRWNIAAGETIRYMTRQCACDSGLLPAAGTDDWWLFDSTTLALMHFDDQGYRIGTELVTDPEAVVRACAWRDLAVHHSTPDSPGSAAA